jgi:hypothetical protein
VKGIPTSLTRRPSRYASAARTQPFNIGGSTLSKRTKPPADTIAISWRIEDVKAIRPDLTDAQAREVLGRAEDKHDAG